MTDIATLLQHFTDLRALVIGDAMLDSYLDGEADRLCREGPVPVVRKTSERHFPGGAANTAANLRALGANVTFLSLVGQDSAGAYLRDELRRRGIHDQALLASPAVQTLHKQRILANGQYIVRVDDGELTREQEIDPTLQKYLLQALEELYPLCDVIVVSDYCYGVVCKALMARLNALIQAHPKVVVLDSKRLENLCDFHATVVTPNYDEARHLVANAPVRDGKTQATPVDAKELGEHLLALLASEQVAITLGSEGVFLMNRQGLSRHLPAYPVAHANDVGAGDSFASALALALAAGGSLEVAAHIGLEAACIAVSRPRTALVYFHELEQRFVQREAVLPASRHKKRKTLANLARLLEMAHQNGQRVVFTNGVFDLLHFGHVSLLHQARELGDILVVALNSDRSVRHLKGAGRPINNEFERLALVEALDAVDYVLLFDEDTPETLIRALRPDIHVKGGDYVDRALPEASVVQECGGRVVIIPRESDKSTSKTIARISEAATHAPVERQAGGKHD